MPEKMSDRRKNLKRARLGSRSSSEASYSSSKSSSSTTSSSSSSEDETDAKDLKPIKEYMNDRKVLASQLFKSVKAEKIRMMLPQTLRRVEFNDLEELCAAELVGMSRTRIMCILNGQDMLQSSDTDDSDNSGPSLEIISDVELVSDEEPAVKKEGVKSKNNGNAKKSKKKLSIKKQQESKSQAKTKEKGKVKNNGKTKTRVKLEKVKSESESKGKKKDKDGAKEKEKEGVKEKEKEGESLLDILELEMRARAIRALIRKEEGSSSKNANSSNTQTSKSTAEASNSNASKEAQARHASLREQLEKIDVLIKHGDDEDVYVVINPAPTIELLSSESETEDSSKRINKKLTNERTSESEKIPEKVKSNQTVEKLINETISRTLPTDVDKSVNENKENDTRASREMGADKIEEVGKNSSSRTPRKGKGLDKDKDKRATNLAKGSQAPNSNLPMSVIENTVDDHQKKSTKTVEDAELEDGEIVDNDDEVDDLVPTTSNDPSSDRKMKKIRRNAHIRTSEKTKETDNKNRDENTSKTSDKQEPVVESKSNPKDTKKFPARKSDTIVIEESPERERDPRGVSQSREENKDENEKVEFFDDKSLDIEEIINLDDYPDDMGVVERPDSDSETKKKETGNEDSVKEADGATSSSNSSETWATRYVQQGDVRNVIKESKIQSEIRKRLRERQKQSKINNNTKSSDQDTSNSTPESQLIKPIGSVEEYLALKGLTSAADIAKADENKSDTCTESGKKTEEPLGIAENSELEGKPRIQSGSSSEKNIVREDELEEKIDSSETNNESCDTNEDPPCDSTIAAQEIATPHQFSMDFLPKKSDKIPFLDSPEMEKEEVVKIVSETKAQVVEPGLKGSEKENAVSVGDTSFSSTSDSSDDNIIVRIDSINPSTITQNSRNQEPNLSSNYKTPDQLRPD